MDKNKLNVIISGEKLVCEALEYLDEQITKTGIIKRPISVKIITNFALLEDPIVGDKDKFNQLLLEISEMYQLDRNWLNNDLSNANIDLKSLEWNIGKLSFHLKEQLRNITIESLDLTDILKMRIISLDSLITAGNLTDNLNLASSILLDIINIINFENINIDDLEKKHYDLIINGDTFKYIRNNIK